MPANKQVAPLAGVISRATCHRLVHQSYFPGVSSLVKVSMSLALAP